MLRESVTFFNKSPPPKKNHFHTRIGKGHLGSIKIAFIYLYLISVGWWQGVLLWLKYQCSWSACNCFVSLFPIQWAFLSSSVIESQDMLILNFFLALPSGSGQIFYPSSSLLCFFQTPVLWGSVCLGRGRLLLPSTRRHQVFAISLQWRGCFQDGGSSVKTCPQ